MRQNTRREFMTSAGAALAGTAVLRAARSAKAAPNDRVRHAVIGLGSQGRRHAKAFAACADCEIVALCDVDPERRAYVAKELGNPPSLDVVEDFRAVLDRDDIDSVSVATPDHWHTPVALAALAAGKHVYVEKPCSHTVHEGVLLAAAAKGSGKCVQHGTQGRSGEGIRDAVQFMGDGNLGKVRLAKAINHQLRGAIGRAPETDPPPGVNYDLWTGPAPAHPFTRNRWHYNWHWF
ncbi:MAG: Gfo/Idh/MocA family oxidoreductase, partial [bacterium]|nr:Gfo/Idh/MocA family oxidoreductase [bacterium]